MRRRAQSVKVASASMVLVDLMATIFVVLVLLWMLTQLHEIEQRDTLNSSVQTVSAQGYQISTWTLPARTGDAHPFARELDSSLPLAELLADRVRFVDSALGWQEVDLASLGESSAFSQWLEFLVAAHETPTIILDIRAHTGVAALFSQLETKGIAYILPPAASDNQVQLDIAIAQLAEQDVEESLPAQEVQGIGTADGSFAEWQLGRILGPVLIFALILFLLWDFHRTRGPLKV